MNFETRTSLWILDYLTNRPELIQISSSVFSDTLCTSTCTSQETVPSPFFFFPSLYTGECICRYADCLIVKFADDTELTGLIFNNNSYYRKEINHIVKWCDNSLELNVKKAKKVIFYQDFIRKDNVLFDEILSKVEVGKRMENYKYLGLIIDNQLGKLMQIRLLKMCIAAHAVSKS